MMNRRIFLAAFVAACAARLSFAGEDTPIDVYLNPD
jgi:hypothetical protein